MVRVAIGPIISIDLLRVDPTIMQHIIDDISDSDAVFATLLILIKALRRTIAKKHFECQSPNVSRYQDV
jgi:hypothetical protein